MSKIDRFEDLDCWQSAKELGLLIYAICKNPELKHEFTAQDQMKRASLSVMNNIAEGFGRFSNKEFVRFLNIATASIDEVHSMILFFTELQLVNQDQQEEIILVISKTKHQTLGLIRYLKTKI